MEIEKWIERGIDFLVDYGPKILGAILIWVIGSWVIKKIIRGVNHVMAKKNYDISLQNFLGNMLGWMLRILLVLAILGNLGVETTSFAAIIAAAGLALGLALQGSLSNFAGGVLIMIFKPFKIGDLIEGQGELGTVTDIDLFTTKITTPQNKLVIMPNGALSNGNITNYSEHGVLKVFHTIGVSYNADIKQTKEVLMEVLTSQDKVLKDPAPMVEVSGLGDSSVDFAVRPACLTEHYWDVYFETLERAKNALDAAGIEIPYPHSVEIQKQG